MNALEFKDELVVFEADDGFVGKWAQRGQASWFILIFDGRFSFGDKMSMFALQKMKIFYQFWTASDVIIM